MKRQVPALKLVRETVRDLTGDELSQAAGGFNTSQLPTCYCVIGTRQPSQLLNPCFVVSGLTCN